MNPKSFLQLWDIWRQNRASLPPSLSVPFNQNRFKYMIKLSNKIRISYCFFAAFWLL
jgi:hypothetical protein